MSFLLARQPLDNQARPLAEPTQSVIGVEDVLHLLVTILDPSNETRPNHQVRLMKVEQVEFTLLYQRPVAFGPLCDEAIELQDCLWWSYEFRSYQGDTSMTLVRKLIKTYATAWSERFPGVYARVLDQLDVPKRSVVQEAPVWPHVPRRGW